MKKKIGDNLKKLVEYWSIKESTYKVEGKQSLKNKC